MTPYPCNIIACTYLEIGYDIDAFDLQPTKSFLQRMLELTFGCIKLVFGHPALSLPLRVIPPPCALWLVSATTFSRYLMIIRIPRWKVSAPPNPHVVIVHVSNIHIMSVSTNYGRGSTELVWEPLHLLTVMVIPSPSQSIFLFFLIFFLYSTASLSLSLRSALSSWKREEERKLKF